MRKATDSITRIPITGTVDGNAFVGMGASFEWEGVPFIAVCPDYKTLERLHHLLKTSKALDPEMCHPVAVVKQSSLSAMKGGIPL